MTRRQGQRPGAEPLPSGGGTGGDRPGAGGGGGGDGDGDGDGDARVSRKLAIVNERGLHARASAKFVETVERFDARARVSRDGQTVDGDSIMGLLTLAAACGTSIDVQTRGRDAEALIAALEDLVAGGFGE